MDARTQALVLLLAAIVTLPLLVGTTVPGLAVLILPIVALTVLVGWGLGRLAQHVRWVLPLLVGVGAGVAVFSVLTGALNGLSDEPYTTPAYASLGWSLYSQPVVVSHAQYGAHYFGISYDVYLPLLTFLQVPGLDYRWVSLAAWAGTLYLLRRNPVAAAGFAVPWVPLLAANGQNDFVPLFALTLALTVPLGRSRWPAEAFSLALKQLANIVVVAYHLARREFWQAGLAVAITVGILAPFLYLDPVGVWCHVIVGDPASTCVGHPWTFFVFKRNYWLYPSWAALVFFDPLAVYARRVRSRFAPPAPAPAA